MIVVDSGDDDNDDDDGGGDGDGDISGGDRGGSNWSGIDWMHVQSICDFEVFLEHQRIKATTIILLNYDNNYNIMYLLMSVSFIKYC